LTLTDWYHDEMPGLLNTYLSATENPSGDEPVPFSNLINESQNVKFNIQPGKTYFVRVISMSAFSANQLIFDGHEMTIIEVDGVYVEKQTTSAIYVAAAQRYGVLITAKPTANKNYAFLASFDLNMFNDPFEQTPTLNPNVTGYLVYNENAPLPGEVMVANFAPLLFNDFHLVPYDNEQLLPAPDQVITLDFDFTEIDGQNR
jgi:iron transport multicopper oxidase